MNRYFLNPGHILITGEPTTIMTVLGSAVAVTLFDPVRKLGGMNHFVRPHLGEDESPTALYAGPATVKLIRMFSELEAIPQNLEAQIFGGAVPLEKDADKTLLGEQNIEAAEKILQESGVTIVGRETGGHHGRKIMFNTWTGEVIIAKVEKIRKDDWFPGNDENR
ncbi:MAG: chemotaxis protein CheD [FCB group bacterium]|nr:chemotaxis protein CheD [FCB group bacterium]